MPIYTTTDDLGVGMKLHLPVTDGRRRLLPQGKTLNAADIDFLRDRCPHATVCIEDPILDQLLNFHDDTRDREVALTAQEKLVTLMAEVQADYESRLTPRCIDVRGIKQTVDGVLHYLHGQQIRSMALLDTSVDDYLNAHSAHVFYLSLMMGNAVRARVNQARKFAPSRVRYGADRDLDLTPLALAALFMDLGMIPLKGLFEQSEPLTLEQCEQIRNHPIASAAALGDDVPELTKLIIETHHENYDGTGYPYALSGEEIHILARILRIADAYSAATAKHIYRQACSPVRALWEMCVGTFSQFYDPVLLKIFSSLIQPYPIGAKVCLNSHQYGVVVRYGKESPFLPHIVIAFDEEGNRLAEDRFVGPIALESEGELRIASFAGEDLTDIYAGRTVIEPPTLAEFTTIYESVYTGCAAVPQR